MQSVLLDTPAGITARLGWDPKIVEHDRKRQLARELVAAHLGVEPKDVRVEREAPGTFGFHTQLIAEVGGREVPLKIRNANFRAATVVAVADPGIPLGLDLRDAHPDDGELFVMKRHSHLFEEDDLPKLLAHWTRVQAVRDADGRGARVAADHVRLDSPLTTGWIPDRKVRYRLTDLSRDSWIITLAHAPAAAAPPA
jgi:4'-phosphopantetheinyl transferase